MPTRRTQSVLEVMLQAKDKTAGTFKKASARLKRLGKTGAEAFGKIRRAAGSAFGKIGALGTLVAGAGFAALIKNALDTSDALGKVADKLGLATEALAGLQHAGALAGVEVAQTDKGLQRMVRSVSEAATGTGLAKEAFEELGLSASVLNSLSADEQFLQIADAMAKVENQSDRVRLGFDIFGRSGVDLLNVLRDGSVQIRATMKDAELLGVTLSRVEAHKIEQANDAIHRMQQFFKGAARQIAVAFAPKITELANGFVQAATDGETLATRIERIANQTDRVANGFALIVNGVRTIFSALLSGVSEVMTVFTQIGEAAQQMMASTFIFGLEQIEKIRPHLESFRDLVNELRGDTSTNGSKLFDTSGIIEELKKEKQELELTRKLREEKNKLARVEVSEAMKAFLVNVRQLEVLKSQSRELDKQTSAREKQRKQRSTLPAGFSAGDGFDIFSVPIKKAQAKDAGASFAKATAEGYQKSWTGFWLPFQKDVAAGQFAAAKSKFFAPFEKLIKGTDEAAKKHRQQWDGIKETVRGVGSIISTSIGGAITDAINGAFDLRRALADIGGQVSGKLINRGVDVAINALLPNAKGNAFFGGQVQPFAKGGVVNSPTLFKHGGGLGVAGEAGDEGILPLKRMRGGDMGVQAAGMGGGGGGMVVINNSATITALDSASVQQWVARPENQSSLFGAIQNQTSRVPRARRFR